MEPTNQTDKVTLDLDTLDREQTHTPSVEPFSIRHNGRAFTFKDAMDIDWQKLMLALQNPHQFFRLTLDPDDAKAFLGGEVESWKMRHLMDRYRQHHGMTEPGEAPGLPS